MSDMEARCMRAIWRDLGMDQFVNGENVCILCGVKGYFRTEIIIDNATRKVIPAYGFRVRGLSMEKDAFCEETEMQRMIQLLRGYGSTSDTD